LPLCTQADLEKFLQIDFTNPAEPVVAYLIEGADALIAKYLGYDPSPEDALVELYDPTFTFELWVRRPPIRGIDSIEIDGVALDPQAFTAYLEGESKAGLVRNLVSRWSSQPRGIEITYDAGFAVVPFDIRDAAVRIVARAFQKGVEFSAEGSVPGIRSISLAGSDSITWSEGADDASLGALVLQFSERQTLSGYKRAWIA